jgi:hypothetical protein
MTADVNGIRKVSRETISRSLNSRERVPIISRYDLGVHRKEGWKSDWLKTTWGGVGVRGVRNLLAPAPTPRQGGEASNASQIHYRASTKILHREAVDIRCLSRYTGGVGAVTPEGNKMSEQKNRPRKEPVSLKMPMDLLEQARQHAEATDSTLTRIIIVAMKRYLQERVEAA